jgi:hypothetical protein
MTNFTQNEIQILDTLGTCIEILAAIQYMTDSILIKDGELNRDSDAYKVWLDPSIAWSGGYCYQSQTAEDVMALAWDLADDDTEHLHWGEYVERR